MYCIYLSIYIYIYLYISIYIYTYMCVCVCCVFHILYSTYRDSESDPGSPSTSQNSRSNSGHTRPGGGHGHLTIPDPSLGGCNAASKLGGSEKASGSQWNQHLKTFIWGTMGLRIVLDSHPWSRPAARFWSRFEWLCYVWAHVRHKTLAPSPLACLFIGAQVFPNKKHRREPFWWIVGW